jgi:cytochrome P450
VQRVAPDPRAFTIEQMDGLDYLDACAQEAMRLKPVAPFIPLEACATAWSATCTCRKAACCGV